MVKRLSSLDATFLHLESPEMPMHVGALHVFELPPGFDGSFVTALRKHMAERLPLAPPLRRRLWMMPMNITNPVWVDAEPDMAKHVVEVKLPARRSRKGGDMAALEKKVGELHVRRLDRARPLWKFHVIEGLAPGPDGRRRVALYTQLHHAAVDGQAAVALANAILDLSAEPGPRAIKASTREKRFRLSLVEMISGAITSEVQQITHLLRALPETAGSLGSAAGSMAARSQLVTGRKQTASLGLAPRMALNAPVTAARAFAAVTLPLPELKALGKRHGATLNDIVLWLVSTALRAHYAAKRELPKKSMVAAVPVSLRAKGDTTADNQASMTLLSLGTHVADPAQRLAHIVAATKSMKSTLSTVRNVLPTDFPSIGVSWFTEAASALYKRATGSEKMPAVANVAISNVPGPPVPLYLAGAKMLTNYPCSIVTHGMALNITVQSYDQSLDFGLMADAQAMPDVRKLGDALIDACAALRELPIDDRDDPAPRPAPRRPAARAKR
ncbi:MAG TPA: wax ester/triacylglycerol synthase family O-acyltransferase [Burkholderiaceae bacterium]|nr:wax ester/triacylglycerol synthase family O-acyltransferase [Burkholderiaceae bacterium]